MHVYVSSILYIVLVLTRSCHVVQGLEAVLDKAVHIEDGRKITRYASGIVLLVLHFIALTQNSCSDYLSYFCQVGLIWRAWVLHNVMHCWYSVPFARLVPHLYIIILS